MGMKSSRVLSLLSLFALVVHISFSYLTQGRIINPKDVGEVSNKFDTLLTPAGFTFAVWGVIYLGLLLFAICHVVLSFTKAESHAANEDMRKIGPWFILNNLFAATWLLVWTREMIGLSVVLILLQLATLIIINQRLGIYNSKRSLGSRAITQIPLSIYFGWVSFASFANIAAWLKSINWQLPLQDITGAVLMLGVAVFITSLVILNRRNIYYGVVVIWALFGIAEKRLNMDPDLYFELIRAAWMGITILFFICVLQFARNYISHRPNKNIPKFSH